MTTSNSPSFTQRIEDAVNAAGNKATYWTLSKLQNLNPPRWLYYGFFASCLAVFIAELKGDLTFQGWLDALISLL